jgi:2-dehydro-3-deoxyphosphogluconate aldolase/(4S)-4-hydroxy-2-oxoglutarate aldolase
MARFNAKQVLEKISQGKLLPLFNEADTDVCASVIDCCYAVGITVFELTNRNARALGVFRELTAMREQRWPDLSLGAGTILDHATADQYIQAGADFIIAPDMNPDVGEACMRAGIPWVPGCLSPTEIATAYRLGAEVIKLFPACTVGPSYIRHIHGPLPFAKIIVTGGVKTDEISARSWLDAGVFALGIGSSLFTEERMENRRFLEIQADLERLVFLTSSYNRE